MMILHSLRGFVMAAMLVLGAIFPQAQSAQAAQVAVTASIEPAISATRLGDVRSNTLWELTIECSDPNCQLTHVYEGRPGQNPVIVHLHGNHYSTCPR